MFCETSNSVKELNITKKVSKHRSGLCVVICLKGNKQSLEPLASIHRENLRVWVTWQAVLEESQQLRWSWKRGMCISARMFGRIKVLFLVHICIWPQGVWNDITDSEYFGKKSSPWKLEVISNRLSWRPPLFSEIWQQPSAPLEYLYLQHWPIDGPVPSSRQAQSTSLSNPKQELCRR